MLKVSNQLQIIRWICPAFKLVAARHLRGLLPILTQHWMEFYQYLSITHGQDVRKFSSSKTQAALARYARNRFLSAYLRGTVHISLWKITYLKSLGAKNWPQILTNLIVNHSECLSYVSIYLCLYCCVSVQCIWTSWLQQCVNFYSSFMAKKGKCIWQILDVLKVLIYFNPVLCGYESGEC